MIDALLDLLFPPRSLGGVPGRSVTPEERRAMRPRPMLWDTARLRRAGAQHLDALAAGCLLDEAPLVRAALHRFKYRRVRAMADVLAPYLHSAAQLLDAPGAVLCPVPLHWSRRFARGFNQSEILARRLSARTAQQTALLLHRRKPTGTQTKRSREERLRAMQDAFVASVGSLPRHVTLVDDVATTLATLDACAHALKRAGVRRVDAVAVALG